jgi:hypothetical protein
MLFFIVFLIQLSLTVCEFRANDESVGNSTAPITSETSSDEYSNVTLSAIVIASIPSFVGFGVAFYLVRKAVLEMQSKKIVMEKSNHSETFEIELSDEVTNSKTVGTLPPTKDSLYMKTFYEWMNANTYTSLSTDSAGPYEAMPCFPFDVSRTNP